MERDGKNGVVGPGAAVLKGAVERAIRIEPHNPAPKVYAIDCREVSADEDLAVALHGDRVNGWRAAAPADFSHSVLKAGVQSAVRIEPGNHVSARAIHETEVPSCEHLAIALHRERRDECGRIITGHSDQSVFEVAV